MVLVPPVRDFEIFLGPGPVRSQVLKFFSVLVRVGPGFLKFFWNGPDQERYARSGTNRFGPWIPAYERTLEFKKRHSQTFLKNGDYLPHQSRPFK